MQFPIQELTTEEMTILEAFSVKDEVICHACQNVTPHHLDFDGETLLLIFVCNECGEEIDEREVLLSQKGDAILNALRT